MDLLLIYLVVGFLVFVILSLIHIANIERTTRWYTIELIHGLCETPISILFCSCIWILILPILSLSLILDLYWDWRDIR